MMEWNGTTIAKKYQRCSVWRFESFSIVNNFFQGILPAVLYCILIWGNCSQTPLNRIDLFIIRLKKSTPDLAVLITANWNPISYYYKRSIACYYGFSSPLLSDLLQKSTRRVTRNALKVDLPTFKYVEYKRSFRYRAAIVWKNLPNDQHELSSYDSFKNNLKKSDILEKISCNLTGGPKEAMILFININWPVKLTFKLDTNMLICIIY